MMKLFTITGLRISFAAISIGLVFACNKSNPAGVNAETSTLTYSLANGTGTTIFYSAVVKAGLDSVFSSPAIFTLFVPNDQACAQSGYPQSVINGFTPDQAKSWVLYQTYAGNALTLQSFIGKSDEKLIMADGDSVFVTGDSNRTYINGFLMLNSQLTASNGVMLALQNVLLPPQQNLEQMLNTDTTLSFLNEAVTLATPVPDSLSVLLSTGGPFTFMAADNDAFRKLGFNSPADLSIVNPDSLRSMVLLSLIPQRLFSYDLPDSSMFLTLSDSILLFHNTGLEASVQVLASPFTSNVISANSMATNGVLFKIDELLDH